MSPRERSMVGRAQFRSYYGQPILKEPVWKVPDVPGYLFLGGLAGASSWLGGLADVTGRPGLARVGRIGAAGAIAGSLGALVHDLGRPERFLNMLRVFKPTSPLSVGSWILAPFSGLATATAAAELAGRVPRLARATGLAAAGLSPALSTYTAVLLANTAVPAWHEAYPEMPFLFAGSALTSGAGLSVALAPLDESGPARAAAVAGAAVELAASTRVERRLGLVGEPYRTGRAGLLLQTGKWLTAAGSLGSVLGRRSRTLSVLSGAAMLVAGACTRFGVFEAGLVSARDPRYVVVPQRERTSTDG